MEVFMNQTNECIQAVKTIEADIRNCEKMLPKFKEGTSQYSLLKNRLKALYISKALILEEEQTYSMDDLQKALPPITSVIQKCKKGQEKHTVNTPTYRRLQSQINAMMIAKSYIEKEIEKNQNIVL
jgi:hypothetical protein